MERPESTGEQQLRRQLHARPELVRGTAAAGADELNGTQPARIAQRDIASGSDLRLEVDASELREVYRALMAVADDRKTLTDEDVVAAVNSVHATRPVAAAPAATRAPRSVASSAPRARLSR